MVGHGATVDLNTGNPWYAVQLAAMQLPFTVLRSAEVRSLADRLAQAYLRGKPMRLTSSADP